MYLTDFNENSSPGKFEDILNGSPQEFETCSSKWNANEETLVSILVFRLFTCIHVYDRLSFISYMDEIY